MLALSCRSKKVYVISPKEVAAYYRDLGFYRICWQRMLIQGSGSDIKAGTKL